jgi:hypothetical protein
MNLWQTAGTLLTPLFFLLNRNQHMSFFAKRHQHSPSANELIQQYLLIPKYSSSLWQSQSKEGNTPTLMLITFIPLAPHQCNNEDKGVEKVYKKIKSPTHCMSLYHHSILGDQCSKKKSWPTVNKIKVL